jgi:tRNA(Ile)-lysidine synthase
VNGETGQVTIDELLPRCSFPPPGTELSCAVSGGADSLALLVLAAAAGCSVLAIHVDHGLRGDSGREADVVAGAAERFGAAFRSERVEVAPGPNLEARARTARYAVLPAGTCTGHTADVRAETVVLNLLRGSGLEGLTGIRRSSRRPILDLRRSETHALCAAVGLVPVDDPSNLDPVHRRNRVRHEVLPLLAEVSDRDPVPVLCRQADLLADEANLLADLAADLDPTDARALAAAPSSLARVAVRRWLRRAGDGHPPSAAAVERVLEVARGAAVATDLPGGWSVRRSSQRLQLLQP